jgi:Tfp pilus assembly protein PilX
MTLLLGRSQRVEREERGAALILAIAFMLVVAVIGASLLSSIVSSLDNRSSLDAARDRQYAADGAIESAIAKARTITTAGGVGLAPCTQPVAPSDHYSSTLNGVAIRVDCANASSLTLGGYLQHNVIFTACVDTGAACTDATAIVRSHVDFEGIGDPLVVSRTYIQSWSVNK